MESTNRPSFFESEKGFGTFVLWVLACVGLYFWNIPPHLLLNFQNLWLSFQYSQWTTSQLVQAWENHLLFGVLFLGWLTVFLGTGEKVLDWGFKLPLFRMEKWVWSLALGWAFWGLLAEALAFEKLFYPRLMEISAVLTFAALFLREPKKIFSRLWPFEQKWREMSGVKWPVGLIVLLSLANLRAPEMSWDAMTYQLVLPDFYFLRHGFYPVTGIVPSHYPAFGQMLFSWGLLGGDDSVARSLAFLAHLGTALGLAVFGTRLENPKVGWTAAVLYWVFPYLNIYSTRGYVDLFTNFYATLGLGALIVFVSARGEKNEGTAVPMEESYGLLGVLALGIVWGFKYNAVSFWLAGLLILTLAFPSLKTKNNLRLGMFLGPFFFLGPWALKSWAYTQNPIYPYLSRVFQTFDWTAFDQRASGIKFQVEGLNGLLKIPAVLWGLFFQNYSGAPNEEVSLIPLVFFPLLFLKGRAGGWKIPIMLAISVPFFFWLVTSHQLRLISSVLALASIPLAVGFQKALFHWPKRGKSLNWIFCFLLWIATYYLFQGLIQQPNPFASFLGFKSKAQFLDEILRPKGYVEVAEALNGNLPSDASVLIIGQQNGYYLNRVSAYDFDYTSPVLKKWTEKSASPDQLYRWFKKSGFTYLLYNANSMLGTALRVDSLGVERYPWHPEELKNYEQFFLKYTRKITLPVANGYSLYEIGPREGFSSLPEYLPGTEHYYLKNMAAIMELPKMTDLIGKSIPRGVYAQAYEKVATDVPEIGLPCFQSAFAELQADPKSVSKALEMAKEGFVRNRDQASWLVLQGDAAISRRNYLKAIEYLKEAEALSPEREDVGRNLAVAYYNEHDVKKAAEEAERAAILAPYSEEYKQLALQLRAAASQ